MSILGEVTKQDIERRGLAHKAGLYVLEFDQVVTKTSRSGNRYMTLQFKPLLYAPDRNAEYGPPDHRAPLFDMITPLTQEGVNRTAAARIVALIAALTGNDNVEEIKKEFDADSVDDLAKKLSALYTLKLLAWVSAREEVDENGTKRIRNNLSNFQPVPEAVAADMLDELEPEDGIPF